MDIPEARVYSVAFDGHVIHWTYLLLRYVAQLHQVLMWKFMMLTIYRSLPGAVLNPLLGRYPQYRRMAIWCGAVICGSSLLAASFASDVIHLVVTQGCLYGLGGGEQIIDRESTSTDCGSRHQRTCLLPDYFLHARMVCQKKRSRERSHVYWFVAFLQLKAVSN